MDIIGGGLCMGCCQYAVVSDQVHHTGLLELPGAASGASGSVGVVQQQNVTATVLMMINVHQPCTYLHLDPCPLARLCVIPQSQSILD